VPRLVQVQDERYADGLVVVGLTAGPAEDVRAFIAEHGVTYPVLRGGDELLDAWGVDVLWGSEIYLVDPDGLVVTRGLDEAEERLAAELDG
jgi:hypothetical protein